MKALKFLDDNIKSINGSKLSGKVLNEMSINIKKNIKYVQIKCFRKPLNSVGQEIKLAEAFKFTLNLTFEVLFLSSSAFHILSDTNHWKDFSETNVIYMSLYFNLLNLVFKL